MVTENKGEQRGYQPPVEQFSPRGGGGYGNPPRGNRGNGGSGIGGILGGVAIVLVLIIAVGGYMWVNSQLSPLQGLPSQVAQFITDTNNTLAGMSSNITAQYSAMAGQISTQIGSALSSSGYITQSQLNQKINNIQEQIDTLETISGSGNVTIAQLLAQITSIQTSLAILQNTIDNSDILHNTITTSVSLASQYFSNNITAGTATMDVVLSIKNNKGNAVILNKLDLALDLESSFGVFGRPLWFMPASPPIVLTYTSVFGTATITSTAVDIFGIVINSMNLNFAANETKQITFKCVLSYTIDGVHSETEINNVVNSFSITPILTQNDYILSS